MAKVTRTPIARLDPLDNAFLAIAKGAIASSPHGDHSIKINVAVNYTLCRVDGQESIQKQRPNKERKKKQPSVDAYKRLYITYSIGGQIEGKTEPFSISGNNWSVVHDINIANEFITNLYHKPPEFVIWEIVRTDDHDKDGPQSLTRKIPNMGDEGEETPSIEFSAKENRSRSDHTQKFPISLAQTAIKTKPVRNSKLNKREMSVPPVKPPKESIVSPSQSQKADVKISETMRSDSEAVNRNNNTTDEPNQNLNSSIKHQFARRQSLSNPDLNVSFEQGAHEFKSLVSKRANSYSPPLDQIRPGSPLHRFLNEDFGIGPQPREKQKGKESIHAPPRASSREAAHPHHFNHPEKHVSADVHQRTPIRSRSSSSLAGIGLMHQKTPPSPHHHDHPLTILAPHGRIKEANSTKTTGHSEKLKNNQIGKIDNCHASMPAHLFKNTLLNKSGHAFREKNKNISSSLDDTKHIRWNMDGTASTRNVNQTALSLEDVEKQSNDQSIDAPTEKLLLDKKKGEYTHIPIGKVVLDVTGFFFDMTEAKASVVNPLNGLSKCDVSLKLDSPLLSNEQAQRLNPLCITIDTADGMPDKPLGFDELDSKCLPVSVKFQFFNDYMLHRSILSNQCHARQMHFNSKHLILTGLIDPARLCDEIFKSPLLIEVHDRDHKLSPDLSKISADLNDNGTINQPMNPVNPYGVASFSLVELCSGETELQLISPILPTKINSTKKHKTLPAGFWLDSSAHLSIFIHLRFPLMNKFSAEPIPTALALFGQVVIASCSSDETIPNLVQSIVTCCNAKALNLSTSSRQPNLSLLTYQLSDSERHSSSLDILTGYDIFDDQVRIMYIEGLIDGNLKVLLSCLQSISDKIPFRVSTSVKALNYPMALRKLPIVLHIRLVQNLQEILHSTKTYIGGKISKECLDCLCMINETINLDSFLVRSNSLAFPTQSMIMALVESIGKVVQFESSIPCKDNLKMVSVCDRQKVLNDLDSAHVAINDKTKQPNLPINYGRYGEPINYPIGSFVLSAKSVVNANNSQVMDQINQRRFHKPNFVSMNIQAQKLQSKAPYQRTTSNDVYNYSMQTYSTTQQQIEDLRTQISKDPTHIYTYCKPYLSQMVSLVDFESEVKTQQLESRRLWKSHKGFWAGPFAKNKDGFIETRCAEL
ncbi:hypothetical protein QVD99_003989 [Batrachochytrium dendrobatidis]|nr:hypothetical protein QVD99_003989 [Batrachochytrium dendrobatidis]